MSALEDKTMTPLTADTLSAGSGGIALTLEGVSHSYDGSNGPVHALSRLDLHVDAGEFVALVGPSGCGKSTLLGLVAGFIQPTEGTVLAGGKQVSAPGPDRGVVFQQSNLFPWLSARDNVAFALRLRGESKSDRYKIADHWLNVVGLSEFGDAAPFELSGGMQQRCQIARVLAADPEVLLLDEPFGALDAMTRERLQNELHRIWAETKRTVIFVTHGVEEAAFLATRVIVLSDRPGRIVMDEQSPLNGLPRTDDFRTDQDLVAFRQKIDHNLRNGDSQ